MNKSYNVKHLERLFNYIIAVFNRIHLNSKINNFNISSFRPIAMTICAFF